MAATRQARSPVDQVAQCSEAAAQDGPRIPVDTDRASLHDVEREDSGIEHVAERVHHMAHPFVSSMDLDSAVMRACSVTAPAIAVSRQRFKT